MRHWLSRGVMGLLMLAMAACGANGEDQRVPTEFVLGDEGTSSVTVTQQEVAPAQATVEMTVTGVLEAATGTEAPAPVSSMTSLPTIPPTRTPTPDQTRVYELGLTENAREMPRIVTLTPAAVGPGTAPPVIQVAVADVVISEAQFQAEIDALLPEVPEISSAVIDFVPGNNAGIRVQMFATGGQAMMTGEVFILFQLTGGLLAISVAEVSAGAAQAPQAFVDVAQNQLFTLIVQAFDNILTRRLGEQHDLETISISETTMDIMLLVPR